MKSTKVYVQYLDRGLDGKLVEAIGDRSVVILDARNSLQTWVKDARSFNGFCRPFYPGFRIYKEVKVIYEEK